jgi:hypothetical protein
LSALAETYQLYASQISNLGSRREARAMSDQDDRDFAGEDDAKAKLRAAMAYLLKGTIGTPRHVIALEIMETLRQVANGWPPGQSDPLDDDLPGG